MTREFFKRQPCRSIASPTSTPLSFSTPLPYNRAHSMDYYTSFPVSVPAEHYRWSASPEAYNSSGSSASPFDDQSFGSGCDSIGSDYFDLPTFDLKAESNDEDGFEPKLPAPSMKVSGCGADSVNVKRRRGRPRKHPIVLPSQDNKSVKGRSKTGCITCRRRKKKCDETRPSCLNCQKNNAICEGYRLPEHWQSGRSRAGDKSKKPRELPVLISGVETDIDRMLLDHFNCNLSQRLCLNGEQRSAFNDVIVPMALRDSGLMHSLLSLSGFHFVAVNQHHMPDNVRPEIIERRHLHFDKAVSLLREKNMAKCHTCDHQNLTDDPTIAQTVMLCLTTTMAGDRYGEYQMHLDAARHLITCQPSPNQDFQNFLTEIVVYLDVVNSITSTTRRSILTTDADNLQVPRKIQPEAGSFLGVLDFLFLSIAKVTSIRDKVRVRRNQGLAPVVDFQTLLDAQTIDVELRDWICPQPEGTPRFTASLLYRVCTWIYLHRTILPSGPDQNLTDAVDEGLEYLRRLAPSDNNQAVLLMPVFLLGCAAFEQRQRPQILAAFDVLQEYRHSGNVQHARNVVSRIWEMMDCGDEASWDWENLMSSLDMDFLIC